MLQGRFLRNEKSHVAKLHMKLLVGKAFLLCVFQLSLSLSLCARTDYLETSGLSLITRGVAHLLHILPVYSEVTIPLLWTRSRPPEEIPLHKVFERKKHSKPHNLIPGVLVWG